MGKHGLSQGVGGGGAFLERKFFLGERKVTFGRIAACYPGAQDVDVCVYNVHHVCACVCVEEGGGGVSYLKCCGLSNSTP